MTQAFDKDYWESHWQQASGHAPGPELVPNPYLAREISRLAPGTALDAGCGEGAEAIWLATAGWQVTAADIFTTTPAIKKNGFVVLEDPQNNFAAQNVVPVLRSDKKSDKLIKVLDAVSAKLTTDELLELNEAVSGDAKTEPAEAAKNWVVEYGLDKPVG